MGEPVYSKFSIPSEVKVEECLEAPKDAKKDPCRLTLEEASAGISIAIERRGDKFQVAPAALPQVQKTFPKYAVPVDELRDYLTVTRKFIEKFGTIEKPTTLAQTFLVVSTESGKVQNAPWSFAGTLTDFIAHGQIKPEEEKMKKLLEYTIRVLVYTYADKNLGDSVVEKLKELAKSTTLSTGAKERVEWLLMVYMVRDKLWSQMKPEMDASAGLGNKLGVSAMFILTFLFVDHAVADKGLNETLFNSKVKDAATTYFEIMKEKSGADKYNPGNNLFEYLKKQLNGLNTVSISEKYKPDFQRRLDYAISEYEKAAAAEMFRILEIQAPEKSWSDFMKFKYGDSPSRAEAMGIILSHIKVDGSSNPPKYKIDMVRMAAGLKAWVKGKPDGQEKTIALETLNYLLLQLFERTEKKMSIYWDKKTQEVPTFYFSGDLGMLNEKKTALEDLIRYARFGAKQAGIKYDPEALPHVPVRKFTLGFELGIGATGFGVFGGMHALPNSEPVYYGKGAAVIAGGMGIGAAAGNLLSYATNTNGGKEWWFDGIGGLVGGTAAGLIYFLAVPKPPGGATPPGGKNCPPTDPGNCQKFPVDEYSPQSYGVSFGGKF